MSSTQVSLLSTLPNKELIATVNSCASTAGSKPQIFTYICTLTQIGKVQTGTRLVSDNFQAREGSRQRSKQLESSLRKLSHAVKAQS